MVVAHCCPGAGMAPDDGGRPRDRQAPETLVLQRRQRSEPLRCLGTSPGKAVIGGDGWPRRRTTGGSPTGTGAEASPARVRRFRRGAAPTPRLECAQDALGSRMERKRPDYLQPIPRSHWEFPWLGLWAVLLLGMAGAGIWLHLKTGDAWNARFQPVVKDQQVETTPPSASSRNTEIAGVSIEEIRRLREQAEREYKKQRAELRCIDGVAFRRIPGGWENVPGETCP